MPLPPGVSHTLASHAWNGERLCFPFPSCLPSLLASQGHPTPCFSTNFPIHFLSLPLPDLLGSSLKYLSPFVGPWQEHRHKFIRTWHRIIRPVGALEACCAGQDTVVGVQQLCLCSSLGLYSCPTLCIELNAVSSISSYIETFLLGLCMQGGF